MTRLGIGYLFQTKILRLLLSTLKSLDLQRFEEQRRQFTKHDGLKRAAASSFSELTQRCAPVIQFKQ